MSASVSGRNILHRGLLILVICLQCTAKNLNGEQPTDEPNKGSPDPIIRVHISDTENRGHFEVGSSFRLKCKYRRNNLVQSGLKFHLRWLRSVLGSDNQNQTIIETDIDSSLSPATIIAATTRIWSVKRDDGLDLELNYFQTSDSGTYYCQAVSAGPNPILIHETSVQIAASNRVYYQAHLGSELGESGDDDSSFDSFQLYSQENLSKLLPSLKIIPSSFVQVPIGEKLQLACITNDLDPDPEPDKLKWTFEQIGDRLDLLEKSPGPTNQMAQNVTVFGNILVIWSMLEEHSGFYRCTYRMDDFNLTAEASAEVQAIRGEQTYSAPLVFVNPELVRLSINGSASIRCETTGYPAPELIWYRVNDFGKSELIVNNTDSSSRYEEQSKIFESHIEGLIVERTDYKDLAAFCRLNRCLVQSQDSSGNPARLRLTGLSMIHLHGAKANHQGQYVCQASNKHGSNQATCIVDVEIKEAPLISIANQHREQTIVLPSEGSNQHHLGSTEQQNVTFTCSVKAGRPKPRLRWLRIGDGMAKTNLESDNLDLYDLMRVSSASSNVKTIVEENGNILTLVIGAITVDDEGDYICLGENDVGRRSAVARLTVQKPASIRILQSSPYVAKLNDSFHLDCLVSGHPIPMDIEWSRTDRGSFFSLIARSMQATGQERAILKFDRVTQEELGEYTCNARDPLNPAMVLRDTIMVVVGDNSTGEQQTARVDTARQNETSSLMPKLMVRPTKMFAPVGSNITLDCLAVSGLQPTLVEWLASSSQLQQNHHQTNIVPYYRGGDISNSGQLLQFGSKLRILNVSKTHEGIYQCKGKNKVGVELAPALIEVIDPRQDESWDSFTLVDGKSPQPSYSSPSGQATRTKVAKFGSNIELKCQVRGVEQSATSWSRDGLELPAGSVQIGHNLWIQKVTNKDNGLYVCSARTKEPNRIIQAKVNLLVEGYQTERLRNLEAKIVGSKSQVHKGDSITLECIITGAGLNETAVKRSTNSSISAEELDELERNVVWTNLHSGQSLFQDNVYILGNLLIIYELVYENSAIYRCNYNDLAQHTDYKLQVLPDSTSPPTEGQSSAFDPANISSDQSANNNIVIANGRRVELRQVPLGSRLVLECNQQAKAGEYFWIRGQSQRMPVFTDNRPLTVESVKTQDSGLYRCRHPSKQSLGHDRDHQFYLVNVLVPVARFTQSPVSFITLPTISGANQQLEVELKFLPEHENGLLLFNGQQQQLAELNHSSSLAPIPGDYLALGMVNGYLEFKFELGDGTTSLKSVQPLSLNRWHRVMIERNRRGALMWVDDQPVVSNSSAGKFFNLNLDSVLFVGGHEQFLYRPTEDHQLYDYSKGFQGCISLLRISRQEINLMARNRSVAVGIFECHKFECDENLCSNFPGKAHAHSPASGSDHLAQQVSGVCQVDRGDFEHRWEPLGGQVSANAGLRCICMPDFAGDRCEESSSQRSDSTLSDRNQNSSSLANSHHKKPQPGQACELSNPCNNIGTIQCQSLTSQSYYCHCRVGFAGTDCSKPVSYDDEYSVQFNPNSFLKLSLNRAQIAESYLRNQPHNVSSLLPADNQFNASNYDRLISMADNQNISFGLLTNSSYGLLFYTGQHTFNLSHTLGVGNPSAPAAPSNKPNRSVSSSQLQQASKSMVVNLMSRLSQSSVTDYLAISLIDGYVEVSFELGSGVTIMRSTQRVNDNQHHSIQLDRSGKHAKLIIDQVNMHVTTSPGRLSKLNSDQEDIYIGGLPLPSTTSSMVNSIHNQPSVVYSSHFANFIGCISQVRINTLGPLNLVKSNHLTELRYAQNLTPCPGEIEAFTSNAKPRKPYTSPPIESDDKGPDELKRRRKRLDSPIDQSTISWQSDKSSSEGDLR